MASQNVLTLGDANFDEEVLKSDQPVLVDFWAEWCMPCKAIAPHLEAIAGEFAGKAKVGKVDIDKHQAVASRYGVTSIPTLLVFKNGEPVNQMVGAVPRAVLQDMLNKAL